MAILPHPWPGWLSIGGMPGEAAIVDVGARILSSDINDGLRPAEAYSLVAAMFTQDPAIHAWLHTDSDYRARLVPKIGGDSIREIGGAPLSSSDDGAVGADLAVVVISCRLSHMQAVGLPATWLSPVGWDDRIGIGPVSGLPPQLGSIPSYAEMLRVYNVAVVPGGEHRTECLLVSTSVAAESLAESVTRAAGLLGWGIDNLGRIRDGDYDEVYQRSLAE